MRIDERLSEQQPEPTEAETKRRNWVQRLSDRTNGWVAPGMVVSFLGLGWTEWGLWDIAHGQVPTGVAKAVVGRVHDFVDGLVARKTGTDSEAGAMVDPTIDRLEIFTGAVALSVAGVVPPELLGAVVAVNAAKATAAITATVRRREIHVVKTGKYGVWPEAIGLGAVSMGSTLEPGAMQDALQMGGTAVTLVGEALGVHALSKYMGPAFGSQPQETGE